MNIDNPHAVLTCKLYIIPKIDANVVRVHARCACEGGRSGH